jgi:SAM-dependent methyltransferase
MRQRRAGKTGTSSTYDREFFDGISEGALRSARIVVPMVIDLCGRPTSVVDIGCGTGGWLHACGEHGVEDFLGIDGDYVSTDHLEIPREHFRAMNLEGSLSLERRFDLVLCLEVAEHLPPEAADHLIGSLVGLGDIVLFSAAIPYQGGHSHINEQWPEYWAEKFRSRGFIVLDPFRARLWCDDRVEKFYAQNLMLCVTADRVEGDTRLASELARTGGAMFPLVHPRVYMPKAESAARLAKLADSTAGRLAKRLLGRPV